MLTRRRSSCRVGGECCGAAAVGLEAEQSASRRWVAEWTPTSTAALLSGWLPLFLQMCLQLLGVWMHSCCWLARRTVSLGASHGVPSPSRRGPSRPSCPSLARDTHCFGCVCVMVLLRARRGRPSTAAAIWWVCLLWPAERPAPPELKTGLSVWHLLPSFLPRCPIDAIIAMLASYLAMPLPVQHVAKRLLPATRRARC